MCESRSKRRHTRDGYLCEADRVLAEIERLAAERQARDAAEAQPSVPAEDEDRTGSR
ncbi:MAG: hypothetical protein WAZ18_00865 [Alphaproteobacteria bacterium]